MTTNEIRSAYLSFFARQKHAVLPSASLLPENDPTTLFTGSGMQPMVPYLLGQPHPQGTRLTDAQKCFRSGDIEEVGDNRHTTFFEMLGNWSLGDYFKTEQIEWMWTFLVHELKLDPSRLYFTCFRGNEALGIPKDEEAAQLWQSKFLSLGIDASIVDFSERDGMQGGRIFYYPETKNWWSRSGVPTKMPVGEPGGPDTEMFWDFGSDLHLHEQSVWKDEPCHVNCDCGRFVEIGNNVFMQYQKTDQGFELLPQKNVDFGGGLERIAQAVADNQDIFLIDLFDAARTQLQSRAGIKYGHNTETTYAYRVILDHLRAATFVVADGAIPSNKDQGYFTRRLIRRSVRFAKTLGIDEAFTGEIVRAFVATYANAYPELTERVEFIVHEIEKEEAKFRKTLEQGLRFFADAMNDRVTGQDPTSGEFAFYMYESFGFPPEVTMEELKKRPDLFAHLDQDRFWQTFQQKKEEHQTLSRAGAEQKFKGGLADQSDMSVKYHTATHLLHAAILRVLGPHATQKGSNITPERLRFDFSHGEKLTDEQKQEIEALVNGAIQQKYPVAFEILPIEQARQRGAIGLFDENYGDQVKVYTVGDPHGTPLAEPDAATFSREFCGGPHVENTGTLGTFKIVKEEAISAGVRRIKAILEEGPK